jgi:hypothetical protein
LFSALYPAALLPPPQLTADLLRPYLGDDPAAVAQRSAIGAKAKAGMKAQLACERMPAFVQSVTAVLDTAYPAWFKTMFFSPVPVAY